MKQRLFVAIDLPRSVKRALGLIQQKLAETIEGVKWESEEKLHITLKFLGNTSTHPQVITDIITKKLTQAQSFIAQFGEVGILLNKTNLIFMEIQKNEELLRVYHMINNVLEESGFVRERHVFYPHITLGRIKNNQLSELPHIKHNITPISVKEVVLFNSMVTAEGSVYTKLLTMLFGKANA